VVVFIIDSHCNESEVEPIYRFLRIALATYGSHFGETAVPNLCSKRARRVTGLQSDIRRIFDDNWHVYGVGKVWQPMELECYGMVRFAVG
jgi:hypothetical protein